MKQILFTETFVMTVLLFVVPVQENIFVRFHEILVVGTPSPHSLVGSCFERFDSGDAHFRRLSHTRETPAEKTNTAPPRTGKLVIKTKR